MSDIWAAVLKEICPAHERPAPQAVHRPRRPREAHQGRHPARALELVAAFQKHFDVMLGLNEKEEPRDRQDLGLTISDHSPEGLIEALPGEIHQRVQRGLPRSCTRPLTRSRPGQTARPWSRVPSRPSRRSPPARATISIPASAWASCLASRPTAACWLASPPAASTSAPAKARAWATWRPCCGIGLREECEWGMTNGREAAIFRYMAKAVDNMSMQPADRLECFGIYQPARQRFEEFGCF